jgi:hypothetical protein
LADHTPVPSAPEATALPVADQAAATSDELAAPSTGPAVLPPAFSDDTESTNEAPPY